MRTQAPDVIEALTKAHDSLVKASESLAEANRSINESRRVIELCLSPAEPAWTRRAV